MCHNIVNGRFHEACGHFIAMSSRLQDCNRPNCLFSGRHEHPFGCKSTECNRMMSLPVRNPIRISGSKCCDCVLNNPDLSRGH